MDSLKLKTGFNLVLYQIWATFLKKSIYTIRNPITVIIQFIIPVVFLIMTMLTEDILAGNKNLPELPIDMRRYLSSVTVLQHDNFNSENIENSIIENYNNLEIFKMNEYELMKTNNDIQEFVLEKVRN